MATLLMKPLAAVLVLIGCVLIALRFAWRDFGWFGKLVCIGWSALVWAAVYGVPA